MRAKRHKKRKSDNQEIAKDRIKELFSLSEDAFDKNEKYANRYMQIANKISLKYKVPFDSSQKIRYCKKCKSYLKAGQNSRIRLNKGKRVILCQNCKNIMRFRYK